MPGSLINPIGDLSDLNQSASAKLAATKYLSDSLTNLGDKISTNIANTKMQSEAANAAPWMLHSFQDAYTDILNGNQASGITKLLGVGATTSNPILQLQAQRALEASLHLTDDLYRNKSLEAQQANEAANRGERSAGTILATEEDNLNASDKEWQQWDSYNNLPAAAKQQWLQQGNAAPEQPTSPRPTYEERQRVLGNFKNSTGSTGSSVPPGVAGTYPEGDLPSSNTPDNQLTQGNQQPFSDVTPGGDATGVIPPTAPTSQPPGVTQVSNTNQPSVAAVQGQQTPPAAAILGNDNFIPFTNDPKTVQRLGVQPGIQGPKVVTTKNADGTFSAKPAELPPEAVDRWKDAQKAIDKVAANPVLDQVVVPLGGIANVEIAGAKDPSSTDGKTVLPIVTVTDPATGKKTTFPWQVRDPQTGILRDVPVDKSWVEDYQSAKTQVGYATSKFDLGKGYKMNAVPLTSQQKLTNYEGFPLNSDPIGLLQKSGVAPDLVQKIAPQVQKVAWDTFDSMMKDSDTQKKYVTSLATGNVDPAILSKFNTQFQDSLNKTLGVNLKEINPAANSKKTIDPNLTAESNAILAKIPEEPSVADAVWNKLKTVFAPVIKTIQDGNKRDQLLTSVAKASIAYQKGQLTKDEYDSIKADAGISDDSKIDQRINDLGLLSRLD